MAVKKTSSDPAAWRQFQFPERVRDRLHAIKNEAQIELLAAEQILRVAIGRFEGRPNHHYFVLPHAEFASSCYRIYARRIQPDFPDGRKFLADYLPRWIKLEIVRPTGAYFRTAPLGWRRALIKFPTVRQYYLRSLDVGLTKAREDFSSGSDEICHEVVDEPTAETRPNVAEAMESPRDRPKDKNGQERNVDLARESNAPGENSESEVARREALLAEYKAAGGNPSNKKIYEAKNSGIHKPEFYDYLKGKLASTSETAKNFERFLREKKPPIPRKPKP